MIDSHLMAKLLWQRKEARAREWCSQENDNIELTSDDVFFWDNDKPYTFKFDIASYKRGREIEKINAEKKQYEEKHGKDSYPRNEFIIKMAKLYGISPGEVDRREIIGMVKSGKHDDGGVTYETILGDCFLLARASADKKYMILTDKKMYDYFNYRCKAILNEIELVYLDCDDLCTTTNSSDSPDRHS